MQFQNHNWMQIEAYVKNDSRVMLILGACEQHGYLSLLTDVQIPMELAKAAAHHSGVIIAPPLNFGCSPYFLDYPGTISLRLHTYLDVIEDILRSLYNEGFRQMLILNGHGGNTPVQTHLVELLNELTDLEIRWYAWWTTQTVARIANKHSFEPQHANWLEAFEFNQVADLPDQAKPFSKNDKRLLNKTATREKMGDGSFGGDYHVDEAIMKEMFNACLADILELLKFE
jgi:creatinine amidohydrolase